MEVRLKLIICTLFTGIKSFIVELVIKISSDEIVNPQVKTYLQKLNLVLVQVIIINFSICLIIKLIQFGVNDFMQDFCENFVFVRELFNKMMVAGKTYCQELLISVKRSHVPGGSSLGC